jgi:glycosyltransferase involved in cell wall biosynthesis
MARKKAIEMATGDYIIFYDNDDLLLPNHFSSYYKFMKQHPSVGLGYFNSFIEPTGKIRNAVLANSQIGHSEIIVKTELAKKFYNVDRWYGHDWEFINTLLKNKVKSSKSFNKYSYIVKGVGRQREKNID